MTYKEALDALEKADKLSSWLWKKGPKLLRVIRKRSGLGVNAFATAYSISPSYVSRCENEWMPLGRDLAEVLLREYLGKIARKGK